MSSTTAVAAPTDDNNNKIDGIGGGGGGQEVNHHPTFIMPVLTLDKIKYIIDTIEKETKRETKLVKYILYSGWSTYTNDPINLLVNSRNPGQGKTHPILAVLSYFPEDDYIILTGSSDKALYHEKGKLVVKDEETGGWVDIGPQLAALEAKKDEVENEYSKKENLSKAEKAERDQKLGEIKKQMADLKNKASKLINLEHKMIVFLDTPNATLLEALMPLLSHDSYHSKYKFTDKKGGSLEAVDNILWGWPTVIFAQTLDISYRKRWPELSRRFIVINPNVSRQKVSDAVDLAIDSASLPDLLYQDEVVSDADINRAKNMVKEIKYELLEFSRNLRKPNGEYDKKKSAVFVPFSQALKDSLPKSGDMNDVTNAKRFLRFQTLSTITQISRRPIIKVTPKIKDSDSTSTDGQQPLKVIEIPIVVFADTEKAIELMADAVNTGLRPEQRQWYEEVFLPTYEAKEEKDWKYDPASKKRSRDENDWIRVYEDVKAVKVEELVKATQKYRNEVISPRDVREKYLDPLYNNGLVDKAASKIDGRKDIFYPVVALFEEEVHTDTAPSEVVDGDREEEKNKKLERKASCSNFLEGSKLHLPDFTSFPRENVIKSRIQRVIEKYNEKGFTATPFDGRENKVELDETVQVYFTKDQSERVFEVEDVNIASAPATVAPKAEHREDKEEDRKKDDTKAYGCSSYYSEQSENRDDSQVLQQKDVRPTDSEESDIRKLEQEPLRSNFSGSGSNESTQRQPSSLAVVAVESILEKNSASELKAKTKTSNQRLGAIGELLKTVEQFTKEGKSLLSLALKDTCIAFDCEWHEPVAGGKIYQFSVMDVLTEKPIETVRITDPYIAGNYTKLVRAIVILIKKRQNKNAKGEIINGVEIVNEQSLGWYTRGQGSDLDRINEACIVTGVPSPIEYAAGNFSPYIAGQEHIDIYSIYKNSLVRSSVFKNKYRALDLGHVGKKVVGLGKYKDLNGLEALGFSLEEQKEYNIRDCEIVAKLAKANDGSLLALMRVISELLLLPFERTCHTELSHWWAHLFQSEGSAKSVNPQTGQPYYWKYEGGLVETPPTGLFHNVRVLDVASLYPTMARRYNLSFDTIECKCCKDDPKAKVPKDVLVSRLGDKVIDRPYWVCCKKKGDFPKFLDEFTDLRLQFKRDKRPELKAVNKVLSDGLKILVNGGYGCFGYPGFKYLDVRVAELVTAYGRYTLRKIMEIASGKYGLRVIYGDTDSVFVEGVNATNDEQIKLFIEEVNGSLNIELEDDKLFKKVLITGKKHYIGAYFDDATRENNTIVKGLEGAKSDRPPFINRMHGNFVNDFEANNGDAVNPWTNISKELERLVNKELPAQDFKIEIQLSKDPSEYSRSLVQYKIGTLMNAKKGDLIWYYKIHNGDTNRARSLEKRDGEFAAYQNPNNISYEKALDDVERTFGVLLQHLGMDPEELFKPYRDKVPKDHLVSILEETSKSEEDEECRKKVGILGGAAS